MTGSDAELNSRGRPSPFSRQATLIIFIAFSAWLLTNVDQSLFGYAIPAIRAEFGVSLSAISLIISASFVAGIIVPIGIGTLTDSMGSRWTLPLCLGLSGLLVGCQGVLHGLFPFASARIMSFGLSAALSPITNSLVIAAAPPRWRAMAVAVLQCAYPLGWFLSSLIVAPFISIVGWRWLFCVGFLIVPIALLMSLGIPRKAKIQSTDFAASGLAQPLQTLFSREHRRTTILCGCTMFFNSGAVAATTFYLPTFLHEIRGYSVPASALIVGSAYGISVVGYIGAALVSLYLLNRRDTIGLWNLLAAGLFAAMIWLPKTYHQDFAAFGLMSVFFYGTSAILITYVLEAFPPALRTTAAAVCGTACVSGSMVVFPVLTALAVEKVGWVASLTFIVPPALLISGGVIMCLPKSICEISDRKKVNHASSANP